MYDWLFSEPMLLYHPTPLQEIRTPLTERNKIRLLVKREDLNHPTVSGNKWWKLKYNLEEAKRLGHHTLLTFGGPFSNHLYATAAAVRELKFKSIGVVRGEEVTNATLQFVGDCGMQLHFVTRELYKQKNEDAFVDSLRLKFGDFYGIPEGGTNKLALKGCQEFAQEYLDHQADYFCLPVGTGGTMAGIIAGISRGTVIGFSVLKGGSFLNDEVDNLMSLPSTANWEVKTEYHFGGYGKVTPTLIQFIKAFESQHRIPLDQVDTGKMMYALFDLLEKGFFYPGSTILALHTGGLQGRSPILNQHEEGRH